MYRTKKYYDNKLYIVQFITIISILLRTIVNLTSIFIIQVILDSLISKDFEKVYHFVKYLIVVLVFYFLLLFLSQYFLRKLFFLGNFSVLEYFYDKFLKSEYNDFKEVKSGEILSKLTSDSIKISDWYSQGKVILVTQSFILFSILMFMCRYNVSITLILFSVILVCFFIIKQISKKLSNCMKSEQKLLGETNQYILQSILGYFDLKQLKKEQYFIDYLKENIINKRIKVNTDLAKYFSLYVGISATVAFILPIVSLLLSVYFIIYKDFSVGSAIAIFSTVRMLDEPINSISDKITVRQTAHKIESELSKTFNNVSNEEKEVLKLSKFNSVNVNISSFYFKDNLILSDFRLEINKGDFLVLKGRSGVGKTTVSNLILRNLQEGAYTLDGEVLINEKDIYKNNIQILGGFLKVNQEPYIYEATIRDNILLGDSYEDRLDEIVRLLHLQELIDKLGYNYLLKENGKNLSGGEKQRLELARILIRRPEFIILDEPTSAMNTNLSELIVENIFNYLKEHNITCMVITHSKEFDKFATDIIEIK